MFAEWKKQVEHGKHGSRMKISIISQYIGISIVFNVEWEI